MELLFEEATVPSSFLFGYETRVANIYEPAIEKVIQDQLTIPRQKVVLSIRHGLSPSSNELHQFGIRKKIEYVVERAIDGKVEKLGERLVYDARYVYNNNMAHLLQHHLTALGLIKHELGLGEKDVMVLFERPIPKMALEVMQLLGYEVLSTNRAVSGNVVNCEVDKNNFFHLLPYVKHLDFQPKPASSPSQVFISRKSSRRLINEREIEAFITPLGYEKIYFEDIPIADQWSIMRNASDIVAIHGAALGNLVFSAFDDKQRFNLIELFSPGLVVNSFRKYMAVLNGRWVGCRGKLTPAVIRDIDLPNKIKCHAFDDFEISVNSLDAAFRYLEEREA